MPNFTYNRDIPNSPNNPSNDQPPLKVNTNSADDLINEDHYSFNDNNGGLHKQVRLVDLLAIPAGLASGIGTSYTKLVTSTGVLQESGLFYTPDNSGDEYQLTRSVTAAKALFGVLTNNYNGAGVAYNGGWTFLPGGLLLQYGYLNNPSNGASIPFPVTFSSVPFSIQLTAVVNDNTTVRTGVSSGTESTSGFTIEITNTAHYTRIYWLAIGL